MSERIDQLADGVATMATWPELLGRLTHVGAVPSDQNGAAARVVCEVKEEVTLPPGFRLSPRQFFPPPGGEPCVDIHDGFATVVHNGTIVTVVDNERADARALEEPQDAEHIAEAVRGGIRRIGELVCSPPFQAMIDELYSHAPEDRPSFVEKVVLDPAERRRRGIDDAAHGVIVQRSEFADQRPTLFCVTKILGLAYPWQKVTITFDSGSPDDEQYVGPEDG
jgi:hypothetical protein